jgi:hypothetical protein
MTTDRAGWWFALAALVLSSGGCSGPGDPSAPDADTGEGRVVLGTGVTQFQPLPRQGSELEITMGGQGGWHVFASVQLFGVTPDGTPLRYRTEAVATGQAVTEPKDVLLTERRVIDRGEHVERLGDRLVLDMREPSDVAGMEVEVTATVEANGTTISDTRTVTFVDRE